VRCFSEVNVISKYTALASVHWPEERGRLDQGTLDLIRKYFYGIVGAILRRTTVFPIVHEYSQAFQDAAISYKPELIFIIQGTYLAPSVLATIANKTGATVFYFHPDDFFNPVNAPRHAVKCVPLYDCVFTPKSFNISEFLGIGAKRVEFLPYAYDPEFHHPVQVTEQDRAIYGSNVTFVGAWRRDRAELLEMLVPYGLKVWGPGWHRVSRRSALHQCLALKGVYREEMCKVFNASKIALGLLNRANRDLHTTRTFEIPACGGFMLAERTTEHLEFFEEGREIECFSNPQELLAKVEYYLAHDDERLRIARAGHQRVLKGGHTYLERMRRVLKVYEEIR